MRPSTDEHVRTRAVRVSRKSYATRRHPSLTPANGRAWGNAKRQVSTVLARCRCSNLGCVQREHLYCGAVKPLARRWPVGIVDFGCLLVVCLAIAGAGPIAASRGHRAGNKGSSASDAWRADALSRGGHDAPPADLVPRRRCLHLGWLQHEACGAIEERKVQLHGRVVVAQVKAYIHVHVVSTSEPARQRAHIAARKAKLAWERAAFTRTARWSEQHLHTT